MSLLLILIFHRTTLIILSLPLLLTPLHKIIFPFLPFQLNAEQFLNLTYNKKLNGTVQESVLYTI